MQRRRHSLILNALDLTARPHQRPVALGARGVSFAIGALYELGGGFD
jgi:hypothetical protein